jgi:hypothetical protein
MGRLRDTTAMGDAMTTTYDPFLPPRSVVIGRASPKHGRYRRLRARVATWLRTCVDYYEAAALYEELNRLSDAELARRGLERPNLARDILKVCNRNSRSSTD